VSTPGILILAAFMSMTIAAQGIRPQDVEYQRAIRMETVDGDKRGAIRQHNELVARYKTSDPAAAAKSLLRIGFLYQSLGDTEAARATFERVLREYPGQKQPAAQAQRALGGSTRRLTQERVAAGVADKGADAVSPDGRWIVFGSREGFVIRRTGSTSDHVSVPQADTPIFSADSKRVIYNYWGGTKSEFRVASLEGRWNPRNVKTSPADVRYYNPGGWAADGQSVLVEIVHQDWTKEIAWLTIASGETRVLMNLGHRRPQDPGERVALSPDGRWIVYSAFPGDPAPNDQRPTDQRERHLYLVPTMGGTPIELVGGNTNVRPVWTPDSRRVVFVSNRSGSFSVWSVTAGERRESPVIEMASSGRVALIGITKSGTLHFARSETGTDLFVADVRADGRVGAPVLLPTRSAGTNFLPASSPDGRFVAYLRARRETRAERYALVVHSMSDHSETVFDSSELGYGKPEWFADGTRLLVIDPGGGGLVLNTATGAFTPVRDVLGFQVGIVRQAYLSADGKTAYVAAGRGAGALTALDLTAGTNRVILPENAGLRRSEIKLSPDGRLLSFITTKAGENMGSLWTVGTDGQGLQELSTSASNRMVVWAGDGGAIYFLEARGDESRLMRVPVNGGAPQDAGLTVPYDRQRGGTLADNRLVFAQEARVRELWVVKNFTAR
jgi:Tol biopolymer transport system component